MSSINFKVITPGGELYSGEIQSLTIRTVDGDITVLPHHFPLVTSIASSICKFVNDKNEEVKAFTGEGLLRVGEEDTQLIVSSFNFKEDIDIERARKAFERARKYLESNDPNIDKKRAEKALIRAEARISLWEGK